MDGWKPFCDIVCRAKVSPFSTPALLLPSDKSLCCGGKLELPSGLYPGSRQMLMSGNQRRLFSSPDASSVELRPNATSTSLPPRPHKQSPEPRRSLKLMELLSNQKAPDFIDKCPWSSLTSFLTPNYAKMPTSVNTVKHVNQAPNANLPAGILSWGCNNWLLTQKDCQLSLVCQELLARGTHSAHIISALCS